MITIDKFKQALATYIDEEFTSKIQGIGKWAIGIGSTFYINKVDEMIEQYMDMLLEMEYVKKDKMICIDKMYADVREQAMKHGDIVQKMPVIGEVKFTAEDIENFYRICKSM